MFLWLFRQLSVRYLGMAKTCDSPKASRTLQTEPDSPNGRSDTPFAISFVNTFAFLIFSLCLYTRSTTSATSPVSAFANSMMRVCRLPLFLWFSLLLCRWVKYILGPRLPKFKLLFLHLVRLFSCTLCNVVLSTIRTSSVKMVRVRLEV